MRGRISNSGCVSNTVRAGLAQKHLNKAQEGKTFEVYQLKKDGTLYAKPTKEYNDHTRFTQAEAAELVKRLEKLNQGKKWVVKEI